MKKTMTYLLNLGRTCLRSAEQMQASFRSCLLAALAVLGLNSACGQQHFEDTDVNGFAELVADTNVIPQDAEVCHAADGCHEEDGKSHNQPVADRHLTYLQCITEHKAQAAEGCIARCYGTHHHAEDGYLSLQECCQPSLRHSALQDRRNN